MAVRPYSDEVVVRRRRVHKKSRNGCRNCKLRSVKCDEQKPTCKKCVSYGVLCTYTRTSSDLRLSVERANQILILPGLPYWRCKNDELFDKFRVRTAFSITFGNRLDLFQKHVGSLASSNPHLFHAVITMTLVHDRHIDPDSKLPTYEAYHWYRATSAFNKALTRRPLGEEPAALLMTAALIGLLTMANIEATKPEEAWPLAAPSPSDLAWLKMCDGKKEVFKVTQQTKVTPSLLWEKLSAFYIDRSVPGILMTSLDKAKAPLPEDFASLFGLSTSVPNPDDPYQWAAKRLVLVLASDSSPESVILGFLFLISAMRPDFKQLLMDKEPRALLLLAWWFAKANELGIWWVSRRSLLEGQAVCMYLEREYPHDLEMQKLLEFPRSVFAPQVNREGIS